MKKSEGFFQKIFGSFAVGSSRVPLRSNIFKGAGGYSQIGSTGGTGKWGQGTRRSPLLGSSSPSNLMSLYYERVDELRGYQLLDVVKLATNFFADYIVNFLEENEKQVVTILDEEGNQDEVKTERINEILIKDLNILNYVRDHVKDMVFYGQYSGMLMKSRDELGHLKFRLEELYDPISVITKKKRNKEGEMDESYLARGEDGKIYEIPKEEAFTLGSNNLRLINDLDEKNKLKGEKKIVPTFGKKEEGDNRSKVLSQSSYSAGEPLFYSLILKVKELIIKELLVSLISLRDLSSTQLFLLQFDKSVPLETAKELCARTTKLANNTNELASFLTSQFDAISFIENVLSQSAKFIPDYNATLGNKNSMLPLDKLSDKLLDIMQTLENCRSAVLSPLGIPATILDSTSGSKWQILQQSERANSRVAGFMVGIKESVTDLVRTIYKILYNEDLEIGRIQLHISEKTSVEYNNQINQSESITGLVNGISGILTNALQVMEASSPLVDSRAFLSYIQGLVKDIDPSTESIITDQTIEMYSNFLQAKFNAMCEQQGIDAATILQSSNNQNQ
jgi:hypothetical protein